MKDTISATDTSSSKRFWSYIKSKRRDHSGISPLKDTNGIVHNDSNSKAKILNDQFSSVFTSNENYNTIPDKGPSPHPSISHIDINEPGVYKLLRNLGPH